MWKHKALTARKSAVQELIRHVVLALLVWYMHSYPLIAHDANCRHQSLTIIMYNAAIMYPSSAHPTMLTLNILPT